MEKKEYIEKIKIYEKGVKRLGELEKELNSLDAKKFKKYEQAIRKKLKSVSRIPEIEEDLRNLKLRIAGVDVDSEKALEDLRQNKKINQISREQKKLRKLGVQSNKLAFLEKRTKFLVNELGEKSEEIGSNSGRIAQEEKDLEKLRNRISNLERIFSLKKQDLDKHYHKKDIRSFLNKRKLKGEINGIKEKINESRLELSKQIAKKALEESIIKKPREKTSIIKPKLFAKEQEKKLPQFPKEKTPSLPQIPSFDSKPSEDFSKLIIKQGVSGNQKPAFPVVPKFGSKLNIPKFIKPELGHKKEKVIKMPLKSFKNKKIPATKFLILKEFENIYSEFEKAKHSIQNFEHLVNKSYITRANEQELILKTLNNFENAFENVSKINSDILKSFKV